MGHSPIIALRTYGAAQSELLAIVCQQLCQYIDFCLVV